MGIDGKDAGIIARLYREQYAVVRSDHGDSEGIEIPREIGQGCVLSSYFFKLIHGAYI